MQTAPEDSVRHEAQVSEAAPWSSTACTRTDLGLNLPAEYAAAAAGLPEEVVFFLTFLLAAKSMSMSKSKVKSSDRFRRPLFTFINFCSLNLLRCLAH